MKEFADELLAQYAIAYATDAPEAKLTVETKRRGVTLRAPARVAEVDQSGHERFADLRLALDALPSEQRDVIVLRFLVGLSPREVAERLGRSEDAVHGLQHRGRRRLRREMQAHPGRARALPLAA